MNWAAIGLYLTGVSAILANVKEISRTHKETRNVDKSEETRTSRIRGRSKDPEDKK